MTARQMILSESYECHLHVNARKQLFASMHFLSPVLDDEDFWRIFESSDLPDSLQILGNECFAVKSLVAHLKKAGHRNAYASKQISEATATALTNERRRNKVFAKG